MKIMYLVTQGEQGGAQKYTLDIVENLNAKNEIFVATGIQKEKKDKWLFESCEKVGVKKENLLKLKNVVREINPLKDILGIIEIYKTLKKIKPEALHLSSSKAGFSGAVAGFFYKIFVGKINIIYTVHGFVFLEPMNFLKKIIYIFLEFFSSLLRDKTILITEKDIEVGKKFLILRKQENFKLIYNGIPDKQILENTEAREFIKSRILENINNEINQVEKSKIELENNFSDKIIIATVANFYKTKGLEYLADTAKKVLENTELTSEVEEKIIFVHIGFGDEEYKQEIENKVKENNLQNNFFFLGKVADASKYFSAFDIFLLTSVEEGLPYTLLEAYTAGANLVSTEVGGIKEMAKSIPIKLCETKNITDISNKILETLNSHEYKNSGTKTLPEIFTINKMVAETFNFY